MVVPEGAEAVSRPSPDYPMLPTIPLSAFSDPKKTKTSHVSKVGPLHTTPLQPLAGPSHSHYCSSLLVRGCVCLPNATVL